MSNNIKKLLEYISPEFIIKFNRVVKFLIIYTIGFLILVAGFNFTMPFVIAFILAVMLKPIKYSILKLNRKLKGIKLSDGFVAFLLTSTIVILIILLIVVIGYQIFIQTEKFVIYITNPDTAKEISSQVEPYVSSILAKMNNIDPSITNKLNEGITELVGIFTKIVRALGENLLSLAISIPTGIISIIIMLIATYFFTKDIEKIQFEIGNVFSNKGLNFIHDVKRKLSGVFGGYIKAYVLIMFTIAFLSFIIFSLAKVEYALPIALLTAVLDFLPLIGAGLVYGILILANYFGGKATAAVILVIGFIIVAIVRQLLEQNLVASFIGVHPLIMIIALFIALTPLGFAGMFYFLGAFLLYRAVI